MDDMKAIENLRYLGHNFNVLLTEVTGLSTPDDTSDLMDGLVAYHELDLKGKFDWLDESVDRVMRIVYTIVKEKLKGM
jgi:hypothetical protein